MTKHPAKYTDSLLEPMDRFLPQEGIILDPFAGTGKIHLLSRPGRITIGNELEFEWAVQGSPSVQGDALRLPFAAGTFDAVCTSPTYGNRMADKTPGRVSYTAYLGKSLRPESSGVMQWGKEYRKFHFSAWKECKRVLKKGGILVLNIKDHIRNKQVVQVTKYHVSALNTLGFVVESHEKIDAPSMRRGRNWEYRVPYESVIKFTLREE